jgi:hypothetical protein
MNPNTLRARVDDAIRSGIDETQWERSVRAEGGGAGLAPLCAGSVERAGAVGTLEHEGILHERRRP